MRKIIVLLLAIVTCTAYAEKSNKKGRIEPAVCEYAIGYDGMRVDSILLTDTATTLYFSIIGMPSLRTRVPCDYYLEDMNREYYKLISMKGLDEERYGTFPLNSKLEFSMSFEPARNGADVFDLLYNDYFMRWRGIWGIHAKSKKLSMKKAKGTIAYPTEERATMVGPVTVKGHFKEAAKDMCPDSVRVQYVLLHEIDGERQNLDWIMVDEDGNFETSFMVGGMAWVYLRTPDRSVPMMLYSDDTITVEIDNSNKQHWQISYSSLAGNDVFQHLMDADPLMTLSLYLEERWNELAILDQLAVSADKARREIKSLIAYLSYKHHLSATEHHLLDIYLNTLIDSYQANRTYSTVAAQNYLLDMKGYYDGEEIEYPHMDVLPSLFYFLQKVDVNDYFYFALPEHQMRTIIATLPFVTYIHFTCDDDTILKLVSRYFGKPVSSSWLQELRHRFYYRKPK